MSLIKLLGVEKTNKIIEKDLEVICANPAFKTLEKKKIFLIGGAGFIGSWLADTLVKLKANTFCIDNLTSGLETNLSHLRDSPNFAFINMDVVYQKDAVASMIAKQNFDYILYLASRASPDDYREDPINTLRAGSIGLENIFSNISFMEQKLIVLFTSTSEIYGDAQEVPTPESYWGFVNPVGIRSCYDESKRFGEAMSKAYERKAGLDVRIARIFNTYGPRIREDGSYGRAVSRFISQALHEKDLTVYGDGSQTRSFCYITDTISALLKMLVDDKAKNQIFNIGNPNEVSISSLANKINALTKFKSNITYHPLPEDDPKRRCPDITKIKSTLGWGPKISLDDGLKKMIKWFTEKQSGGN